MPLCSKPGRHRKKKCSLCYEEASYLSKDDISSPVCQPECFHMYKTVLTKRGKSALLLEAWSFSRWMPLSEGEGEENSELQKWSLWAEAGPQQGQSPVPSCRMCDCRHYNRLNASIQCTNGAIMYADIIIRRTGGGCTCLHLQASNYEISIQCMEIWILALNIS